MGIHHHGHHHGHDHGSHGHGASTTKRITFALVLNASFTIIELIGGWWTGSVAVLADAVHDLGDTMALGVALYLERRASDRPSPSFTYGPKRLSLVSALFTGVVLIFGAVIIIKESVLRLMQGGSEPNAPGMIGLALLGLSVNGIAAWRLLKGQTHNEKMLSWHLIEDVLGWAAVLIGAILLHFWKWYWLDPMLALLISGFVAWNALRQLTQILLALAQKTPPEFDREVFKRELLRISGVVDIHDFHVWTLDGEKHVASMHIVVDRLEAGAEIKGQIRHLALHHGIVHTTIESETKGDLCQEDCESTPSN